MKIKRILNRPVNSNCFVVEAEAGGVCVVVDPGHHDAEVLLRGIGSEVEYILLTHEHFDHVWAVEALRARYPQVRVVATRRCSEAIVSRKGNMSVYYDGEGFELRPADVVIDGPTTLTWGALELQLIPTPGHTPGSMCVAVEGPDVLFTGDTVIPHIRTVLKLPGGSREQLIRSFEELRRQFGGNEKMTIYPGHGNPAKLNEIELKDIL